MSSPSNFCQLHVHSEYSSLDGACKITELVKLAKEMGHSAVGLSDHGTMSGLPKFYLACKDAGIRPVLSCEIYLTPDRHHKKRESTTWHLGLIARTTEGYHNLCQITSRAFIEGYFNRHGRADWEILEQHSEGIIALTGCMAAPVMSEIFKGDLTQARANTERLISIFGAENVYGEIQNVGIVEEIPADSELAEKIGGTQLSQTQANRELAEICGDLGLKLVGTGDVHYLRESDAIPHDALVCVGTGQLQSRTPAGEVDLDPAGAKEEPRRRRRFSLLPKKYYFRSEEEMLEALPEWPEALANTVELAERCEAEIPFGQEMLPSFPVPAEFEDSEAYLRHLCEEGMVRRYGPRETQTAEQRERLEFELGVIHRMGFDDYFLIVWDFVNEAQRRGIPSGPGRGSAAGSIVAYSLGVTKLDPLRFGLLFERFLNPDRISMPDVDWDVSIARRAEIIEYVREKYNTLADCETAVSQIITHGTIGAKAGLRDATRVLNHPLALGDRLAKMVPDKPVGISLRETYASVPDFRRAFESDPAAKDVITLAGWMEGFVRSEGVHAAGVVIWDRPLEKVMPLQKKGDDEPLTTSYEMKYVEKMGALKMDFLGLRNLDIIDRAIEIVRHTEGIELDPYDLPLDDAGTYEMLSRGEAIGVFQLESAGMREALRLIKPTAFTDIIALVALYRPGPMDYIPSYAARKQGREPVEYLDPRLEAITGESYGICLTGDSIVTDVRSGRRLRLDEVRPESGIEVQGVDPETWAPATGRVTHWMDNGVRPVFEVRLKGGQSLRATANHEFLTESGWRRLDQLSPGDFLGTPRYQLAAAPASDQKRLAQLRTLGYILADGGLTVGISFYNSDPRLLDAFKKSCSAGFGPHSFRCRTGLRNVGRVEVSHAPGAPYHSPSEFDRYLRSVGLRWKTDTNGRRGAKSEEKFVPADVFETDIEGISEFLAALFDCDGHVNRRGAFLKTISDRLARDVKALLLRLGITCTIYWSLYTKSNGNEQIAYQVMVHDTAGFGRLIQPRMRSVAKRSVVLTGRGGGGTTDRAQLRREVELSGKTLTDVGRRAGTGALVFTPGMIERYPRVKQSTMAKIRSVVDTPVLSRLANVCWDEITAITPAGDERVFDITVEGIHSFIACELIVHNCVFQEQLMQTAKDVAGFSPGEADTLRKAIGKKDQELMSTLKPAFISGAAKNGVAKSVAEQMWSDNEKAGDYSFNKSHAACYAQLAYATAYLKHNHPAAYMAALMTWNSATKDKVPLFITESRRMGLKVLPPDINRSLRDFAVMEIDGWDLLPEDQKATTERFEILFGLGAVNKVGDKVISVIRSERDANGPYRSLQDLITRLPDLNKGVLEQLVKAGAFDCFGAPRKAMVDAVPQIIEARKKATRAAEKEFSGRLVLAVQEAMIAPEAVPEPEESGTLFEMAVATAPRGASKGKITTPQKRGLEALALSCLSSGVLPPPVKARATVLEALVKEDTRRWKAALRKEGVAAEEIEAEASRRVAEGDAQRAEQAEELSTLALPALESILEARAGGDLESALAEMETPISSEEWDELTLLNIERETLGFYASAHPLDSSMAQWRRYASHAVAGLSGDQIGSVVTVVGAVTAERILRKKTGERFGLEVVVEDPTGSLPVTFFNDNLDESDAPLLAAGSLVAIKAKVVEDTFKGAKKDAESESTEEGDAESKAIKLNGLSVSPWKPDQVDLTPVKPLEIVLPPERREPRVIAQLNQILDGHPGGSSVIVVIDGKRHRLQKRVQIGPSLEREVSGLISVG